MTKRSRSPLRPVLSIALTVAIFASGCTPSESEPTASPADSTGSSKPDATPPAGNPPAKATQPSEPAGESASEGNATETGDAKPDSTPKDMSSLINRLAADKARQEANAPKPVEIVIPDTGEVDRGVSTTAKAFVAALAAGDAEKATTVFLADEEVPDLFSATFSRLLASTRGDLNVKEWETFQALADGKKVEYVGVETVRPSVADPKVHPLYKEPTLFIDALNVDVKVDGRLFQLTLKHLIHRDDQWKFLQFVVIDPDAPPAESGGN
ncbi:MAG: hypothetical protein AAF488_03375 [Planctomycetota bacterium]